jgi:hypothetical protein
MEHPIPSLSNIVALASATERARPGVVADARRQRNAPRDERFPSHFYLPCMSALRDYVKNGCSGRYFEDAALGADSRRAPSFEEIGRGLKAIADQLHPTRSKLGQPIAYLDDANETVVRVKPHLIFTLEDGTEYWCYTHFRRAKLPPRARAIIEHSLARVADMEPRFIPPRAAIIDARRATLDLVDRASANDLQAQARLLHEVHSFQALWNEVV